MEVTVNKRVSGKKILCLLRRFESLHLPFAPSGVNRHAKGALDQS
jgi:hypothetical protein